MDDKVYVSHSRLKNHTVCPARNYFAGMEKAGTIQTEFAMPLVAGSAAHFAIEKDLKGTTRSINSIATEYLYLELEKHQTENISKDTILKGEEMIRKSLANYEAHFREHLKKTIINPEEQVEKKLQVELYPDVIFTGIVDVVLNDGSHADWKTGRVDDSTEEALKMDPQGTIYYILSKKLGLTVPKKFVYVYLQGLNVNLVKKTYKSGAKAGQDYYAKDEENPRLRFSFEVPQSDERAEKLEKNYLVPVIESFKAGHIYKVATKMNCGSCMYRKVCPEYDLPTVLPQEHKEIIVP